MFARARQAQCEAPLVTEYRCRFAVDFYRDQGRGGGDQRHGDFAAGQQFSTDAGVPGNRRVPAGRLTGTLDDTGVLSPAEHVFALHRDPPRYHHGPGAGQGAAGRGMAVVFFGEQIGRRRHRQIDVGLWNADAKACRRCLGHRQAGHIGTVGEARIDVVGQAAGWLSGAFRRARTSLRRAAPVAPANY